MGEHKAPYRTVYITLLISPPPGPASMVDISTVGIVSETKRLALEASIGELSADESFGIGTLLGVDQSTLENRPRWGGVIHTV